MGWTRAVPAHAGHDTRFGKGGADIPARGVIAGCAAARAWTAALIFGLVIDLLLGTYPKGRRDALQTGV